MGRQLARAAGSARLEILPILFDCLRRLYRIVRVDAAIFQERIWLFDRSSVVARGVLFSAGRRLPRFRRLAVRSLRRPCRHLVGVVGCVGLPLPALLSKNRIDRSHHRWPSAVWHLAAAVVVHRSCCSRSASPSPAAWHRPSNISATISPTHGRRVRHRRHGRRLGRFPAADHVRRDPRSSWRSIRAASCCSTASSRYR